MQCVKEYLLSKYFSSFGYIVAISYVPALVIFAGYTGQLRTSERRSFRCPSSPDSRDDCLVKYDEQFNSPFPLYGFVLLCFVPPLAVCIAYSWCFVKSRVDELEAALKADPENPGPQPRVTTRRVFYFYIFHLLVRLVLGILFTLLQNFLFYPGGFPTKFDCVSSTVNPTVNTTAINTTKDDSFAINCDNSVGADNAMWAKWIVAVNIFLVLLVFGEFCYLLLRAKRNEHFTLDSEFFQRYFFNSGGTPVVLRDYTSRMKRRTNKETEFLEPLIAQTRNNRLLDDIFVDLVIYTGRAKHEFVDLSKRHEIFDIYMKPEEGAVHINKLEELLLPNEDSEEPRKILVVGRPGFGKSLLCTKLWRDWSKDDLLLDSRRSFEHMFVFQFRWFNTETTEKMEMISLQQLISLLCPERNIDRKVFQYMLDNPEKILLVFDGLDEFKYHESFLEDRRAQGGNSPTEEMPFSTLYLKLMNGNQLPGATVLTTCRPNVVQSVAHLQFDRQVEIMGFTPGKVKEYIHRFCGYSTETEDIMWRHVSSNLELLSLCYIPMHSFLICSYLEKVIQLQDQGSQSSLPTTSTEIYEGALRLFIFKHHPEFKGRPLTKDYLVGNAGFSDTIDETLSQVGLLAKTGIEEGRLLFNSVEVQGMENCGLFNHIPQREISPFRFNSHICFIHLTLQEMLAAREIAKMDPNDICLFITSNVSDPKWHLVIQFLAGLLRGQENEAVNGIVSLLCDCLTNVSACEYQAKQKALLMMKCLHEYNNESTVEKAASELQRNSKFRNRIDLSCCQVTPVDCIAIAFFIKHLEFSVLDLKGNNIKDQGVPYLCNVLKNVNCKVTELNLASNSVTDQGILHLCNALKDVNCKLTKLNLSYNNIPCQGLSQLSKTLKDVNCGLTHLNLSYNHISDQGASCLCDALKDVNCKLTELTLGCNIITDQVLCCLNDALKDVNCKLIKLNLEHNRIEDQGVSQLCDALKNVNCKLEELNLNGSNVTDQRVSHLCNALKDANCNLTVLNLVENIITDQGVSQLCDALKDKNCKLIELNLKCNNVKAKGVSHLSEALKDSNCELSKLNLSYNSITAPGVVILCDALKDINCQLTELHLSHVDAFGDNLALSSALKFVNCKLTELDFSENYILPKFFVDLGISLSDVNCKLTKLNLSKTNVSDLVVSTLCDSLKNVNCKLTVLNLARNTVTDKGVSHLCDAVKDENCKLTKLNLMFNRIPDEGVPHLCDALKDENCKLTELDLSSNKITKEGSIQLCDALKDANCKLTELNL